MFKNFLLLLLDLALVFGVDDVDLAPDLAFVVVVVLVLVLVSVLVLVLVLVSVLVLLDLSLKSFLLLLVFDVNSFRFRCLLLLLVIIECLLSLHLASPFLPWTTLPLSMRKFPFAHSPNSGLLV